jgi:MSHA biogenesis protein MshJ
MIKQLREKLEKALHNVDRLTLRERLSLLAAVLVVLGGLWEALLASPLEARERVAAERIVTLKQRLDRLNESVTVAAAGMSSDLPNHFERLRVLRQSVAEGEEAVRIFTSDLVDPAQMRFVLEELLRGQTGLELISVSNLEVAPLFEESAGAAIAESPKLYRHTLLVTLEGRYLDCLRYLQAVEQLPWQLYWARLDLEADSYPTNKIVIELHTLSLEREWIGV